MKRLTCVLCCLALFCALAGCTQPPASLSSAQVSDHALNAQTQTVSLAYNREDSLNPYKATTDINLTLATLLYDSLVTVSAQFMPEDSMAKVVQTDALHLQATLRANLKFSNGKAVTAADVVYAFQCAKACAAYQNRLANVVSAKANGKTVTFTLQKADVDAAACLCFPIIQKGSDDTLPIGSGRYVYSAADNTLTCNPHRATASAPQTIKLVHLVSDAAVMQALENGSIHYAYNDLSDGNIPRTAAKDKTVDLTQLVFIGVNSSRPLLNTVAYRRALSAAVDRTAITAAAYAGRALAASSPFHPKWKKAENLTCIATGAQTNVLQTLVKQAYAEAAAVTASTTAHTTVATATATTATAATTATTAKAAQSFTLLYPTGNNCREAAVKMLVSQFASAGITVTPTPLPYDTYISRLQAGDFDLYLGEIRLTPNMDLSPLLLSGGAAAYGTAVNTPASAAYTAYKSGDGSAAAFITAFGEHMPYIPLFWRQGMAAYTDTFVVSTPLMYDLFGGV